MPASMLALRYTAGQESCHQRAGRWLSLTRLSCAPWVESTRDHRRCDKMGADPTICLLENSNTEAQYEIVLIHALPEGRAILSSLCHIIQQTSVSIHARPEGRAIRPSYNSMKMQALHTNEREPSISSSHEGDTSVCRRHLLSRFQ